MKYICPMHPEIISDTPGRCPKCGMALIPKGTKIMPSNNQSLGPLTWKSYLPLLTIVSMIFLVSLIIAFKNADAGTFFAHLIAYFMTGFFLTFSMFKLMDLKGFAAGYSTYDLLAKRFFTYGYLYPFIELFFGIAMIIDYQNHALLWAEIIVMTFSGLGVTAQIAKHEEIQCVCLGTFLKVPLTKVTIIEDFGMAALALAMLFI